MTEKEVLRVLLDIGDWWERNGDTIYELSSLSGYDDIEPDELDFVDEAIFELTGKYRDQIVHLNHWNKLEENE